MLRWSCPAIVAGFFIAGAGLAQEDEGAERSWPEQNTASTAGQQQRQARLEEIVVTGERKRAENLQNVPVAISAFNAEMLEARGIYSPEELQFNVPSLTVSQSRFAGAASVTLRGIGQDPTSGDPGVPVHINGHYSPATSYVLRDMLDIERIEVQRGPQGTLWGRNALGGNINIITQRPSHEIEGMIKLDFGNYDKREIQAVVSGPINDRLRARVAVADDRRDGYIENLSLIGGDRENADYSSIRASVEFDLTENVEIYATAYYFKDEANNYVRRLTSDPDNPNNEAPFVADTNTPPVTKDESTSMTFDVTWDIGVVEFRSLSSYDDTFTKRIWDLDGTSTISAETHFFDQNKTFSHELQLLSGADSSLNWVVGVHYYDQNNENVPGEGDMFRGAIFAPGNCISGCTPGAPARTVIAQDNSVDVTSKALFGQMDYTVSSRLGLILGARYTEDNKEGRFIIGVAPEEPGGGPIQVPPLMTLWESEGDWDEVTGKVALNYHVQDNKMLYASWSRGYRSGAFDGSGFPYEPEVLDAYEVGLKSRWFDERLQANVAAFYYDYTNKQDAHSVPNPDIPGGFIVEVSNASSASANGMEFELQALVSEAFSVEWSLGYLDATFDRFVTADLNVPPPVLMNLAGNKLPYSPEWTTRVAAEYTWELGAIGRIIARGDYAYTDEQFGSAFNRRGNDVLIANGDLLESSSFVNARLSWEAPDADWSAQLYGDNLTDEVVQSSAVVLGPENIVATYYAPRTYGIRVTRYF